MTIGEADAPEDVKYDVRPYVRQRQGSRGPWFFAAFLAVGAIVLFSALEARRETIVAPAISPIADEPVGIVSSAPELFIPPSYEIEGVPKIAIPEQAATRSAAQVIPASAGNNSMPRPTRLADTGPIRQNPAADRAPPSPPAPYVPAPLSAQPSPIAPNMTAVNRAADFGSQEDRVTATHFANPATTVPKGTIILAVLETALDSTRAGYTRAIVSRDVFGLDGSRILIPKGSRLIGEYKADLASGQKRALVQWQRLMRPDGAVIEIESPAADQLGRAGVLGRVDSHFFKRFGEALLQSVVSIGTKVAFHEVTGGSVVYAVPIPTDNASVSSPTQIQPTLKVKHGTSVSVFVAKDLDFTAVTR